MTQGFDSADWDSVPDVGLDGRTICPYPTTAPGGISWHDYFEQLKEQGIINYGDRSEAVEDDDEDDGTEVFKGYGPVRVTREAEEFDEPISPLQSYIKLAHKHGWEIESIAHAFSEAAGKPYGTGEKAGQMRPDYEIETQWAHLRKAGAGKVSISYTIINGTARGNYTLRLHQGQSKSDAGIRAIIKGESNG